MAILFGNLHGWQNQRLTFLTFEMCFEIVLVAKKRDRGMKTEKGLTFIIFILTKLDFITPKCYLDLVMYIETYVWNVWSNES